jgi:predicted N-formylglutamate amidohydrolase
MHSDPPPFERQFRDGPTPALLVCDHASWRVPARLQNLGLDERELRRHIGWDIGALALARALSVRLDLSLVAAGFSRLVIDCNRHLDDATSIVAVSDGTPVPGNRHLSREERQRRVRDCFEPYHAAIAAEMLRLQQRVAAPALIAIHSFTPVMAGVQRPWQCGILWDRDPRLPVPLLAALSRVPGITVGDNQPYSGRHPEDYTIERHAESHGRPHVCIEIRQDQLQNEPDIEHWAERLATALAPILGQASLYRAADPYRPDRIARGAPP